MRLRATQAVHAYATRLLCLAAVGLFLGGAGARADEYFLTLRSGELFADVPTLAAMDGGTRKNLFKSRRTAILSDQASVASAAAEIGATVHQRFSKLGNVIKITATPDQIAELASHPEVLHVNRVRSYEPLTARSVPFIHAPEAWLRRRHSLTGRGVRIGIIDSGIDYHHANFGGSGDVADYDNNDPNIIEPGTFPTEKVVGGFDFAGDDYAGGAVGIPDPDPLDCRLNGHGSHVAGIAAGFGVLTNGTTFEGRYSIALDFSSFEIGPGVAPGAELYALKVFGCFGSTQLLLDALEWAADPNGDGDFEDRLDVVNISLGTSYGVFNPDEPEGRAIRNLVDLGCVVVVAAGNDGNTFYSVGFPAVVPEATTVAASIDDGIATRAIAIESPASIAGTMEAVEGAFTEPLLFIEPFTAEIVATEPADACDPITNPGDLSGKIALIDRGTCFFEDKIRRAEEAGAIAAIIANNVDEPLITMGGNGGTVGIPGVMISMENGALIRAELGQPVLATLDDSLIHERVDLADQVYEFSARGPAAPSNQVKPDISAPGQSIISTSAGEGTLGRSLSGTSMAAPHIAGAAALLREAFPTLSAREIKQRLLNTASPSMRTADGDPYAATRVGAGRVDVAEAVKSPITVGMSSGDSGGVAGLGLLEVNDRDVREISVTVRNPSTSPATFGISIDDPDSDGFSVTSPQSAFTIPPGASAELPLEVTLDPVSFTGALSPDTPRTISGMPRQGVFEAEARIIFTDGTTPITLPIQAVIRAASTHNITTGTIGAGSVTELSLGMSGTTPHPAPWVSILEAAPSDAIPFTRGPTPNRIAAIGAASNFSTRGEEADLFFGLAMRADWATPQPVLFAATFEIDTDGDGYADFSLRNTTRGILDAVSLFDPSATDDVHISLLERLRTSTFLSTRPINALDPSTHETALMNNSVMVLATPLSDLGVPPTTQIIRYRLRVSLDDGLDGITLAPTGWVTFNPRRPAIDATFAGEGNTPFQSAVSTPRIRIGSEATSPRALLLHHSKIGPTRYNVVNLRTDTDDSDGDGLDDVLELLFFHSLATANGTSDFDGDSITDIDEFSNGLDPTSSFPTVPVTIISLTAPGRAELLWEGEPEHAYTVEQTGGIFGPWRPASGLISGRPGDNRFVISRSTDTTRFYRIRQLP